jgi:UDP-glucose 4-epimerase
MHQIATSLASSRILITGVTGFIGSYLAKYLAASGAMVGGMDIVAPTNISLAYFHCAGINKTALQEVFENFKPTVCIHCAGSASVPFSVENPLFDYEQNTYTTYQLLEALRVYQPTCKFILLSSAAVYGNPQQLPITENSPTQPISPYGMHKLMAEMACQEYTNLYNIPTAIVRIFSAYGSGLRKQVIWDICEKTKLQPHILLKGKGDETRDFIHVTDIVQGIVAVLQHGDYQASIYNLASGESVSIKHLVELLLHTINPAYQVTFDGIAPVGNPLYWEADNTKITKLGFLPTISLQEGIKQYVSWWTSIQ